LRPNQGISTKISKGFALLEVQNCFRVFDSIKAWKSSNQQAIKTTTRFFWLKVSFPLCFGPEI
jgi:hypothetical protein